LCKKWKTLPWRRNAALSYDKAQRIFLRWARALPAPAHERTDMLDAPTILDESRYSHCIAACNACAATCDFCAAACLREPDPRHMAKCIALDMDCADTCRLAAATMARESPHVNYVCELCARICESCAQECMSHAADHCQDCAEACKRCASLCRDMIA